MKSRLLVFAFFSVNAFAMSAGEVAATLGYSASPPGDSVPQAQSQSSLAKTVLCTLRRNAALIPGLLSQMTLEIPAGHTHGVLGVDRRTGYDYSFIEVGRTVYARTASGRVAVYACRK